MAQLTITGLILGWLTRKPATRLYPFENRGPIPGSRGHIEIDIEVCTFCTLCQKKCPTAAITVDRPGKVWSIDRLRCIQCGACVEPCPKKCLDLMEGYSPSVTTKGQDVFKPSPKPAVAPEAPKA